MDYDFATLSHSQFEDLARDLIGRELKVRFEAFPEGPDDGMDGRHAAADGAIILQAKHYHRSGLSKLKSTLKKERISIDALDPSRYILVTSAPLTPGNKRDLAQIIGPALLSPGDILGPKDLNALLRKFPDIEEAHANLWSQNAVILRKVVDEAVTEAMAKPRKVPDVVAALLPSKSSANVAAEPPAQDTVFILKSSFPEDDEFALWLAPKLEAEGYRVFADILTLEPGDRWRREIGRALEIRAVKVLLICRNTTSDDQSVQDDIDIALDVARARGDKRFIIPLRLEAGRKIKGIGDAVPVDFVRGWGEGLATLLDALRRQRVPKRDEREINPSWEMFRRRGAIPLLNEPERLTSNWLRIVEAPDTIHFFEAAGALDLGQLKRVVAAFPYPISIHGRGFLTFAGQHEIDTAFREFGRFALKNSIPLMKFAENGSEPLGLERQPAQNLLTTMFKDAWYRFCKDRGLIEYRYSNSVGFHASAALVSTGQRIPWGKQGERRSSMLRNIAKGHIWQFGVTAIPKFWPFWHVELKSRVLFASDNGTAEGLVIDDAKKMHRLRRSICKGWRNKQWYGRMLAFLELISGESAFVRLRLSAEVDLVLEASPILFSSPVSTALPDVLGEDDEETDASTLGRPEPEIEEEPA